MSENFIDNVVFGGSTLGVSGNAVSIGTAAGAKSVIFNNSDSIGHLAWQPTAARTISLPDAGGVIALTSQGILSISAGTTRATSGEVVFSNSNNVSFGLNGNTVTATITVAAQSNQTVGLYGLGNTTQNSSTTLDARTLSFNGLGIVTVGFSNGSIQVSATQSAQTVGLYGLGNTTQNSSTTLDARTLSFNGLGIITVGYSNGSIQVSATQSAQTDGFYAVGNTTQNSSTTLDARTVSFGGRGDITVGYSNGTIQISGTQTNQSAIKGFGASNTGNTAGNTGISTGIDWVIAGTNNITVSESTVGGGPNTIWLSGAAGGAGLSVGLSNVGNTSGDTVVVTGRVVFAGGNNVTVSGSSNAGSMTITISAGAGGYGGNMNWYGLGNTTDNSSSSINTSAVSLNALGGMTVGYSNGSIELSSPLTTGLYAGTNISLSASSNSVTISALDRTISAAEPFQPWTPYATAGTWTFQNSVLYVYPVVFDQFVTCDAMVFPVQASGFTTSTTPVTNSTATTGSSTSAQAGMSLDLIIFSNGTGGYSTNLYTYFKTQATFSSAMSWSQTNSNTTTGSNTMGSTIGYTYGFPGVTSGTMTSQNAGSTVTTWGTTTISSTASTSSSGGTFPSITLWQSSKVMYLPFATLVTPGLNFIGIMRQSSTAGVVNIALSGGNMTFRGSTFTSYDQNSGWAFYGSSIQTATMWKNPGWDGRGVFSVTYASSVTSYASSGKSSGAIHITGINYSTANQTSATFFNPYLRLVYQYPF